MKKYIACLLLAFMLLGICSCAGVEDTDGSGGESDNNSESQSSLGSTQNAEFLVSELSKYKVIYKSGISLDTLKKVRELQAAVEKKYGVELSSSGDSAKVGEYEILIGRTNRPESRTAATDAPKIDDYAISLVDKKIALTAYTEDKLILGIDKLIALINGMSDERLFFNESCKVSVLGTYNKDSLSFCGSSAFDYTIVYADNDEGKALGELLRDMISEESGYVLDISEKQVEGKMILVGKTEKGAPSGISAPNSAGKYYMGISEGNLYLYGADLISSCKAIDALRELISSASGKAVDIDVNKGTASFTDTSMTTMTFNVLCDSVSDSRDAHVIAAIRKHMPDTFGVQEATGRWINVLNNALSSDYAYVGIGRYGTTDSWDEHSAIFYKKNKFNLIASGTKWMSDTPDVAGSKYSDSTLPRIFTYAVLENKATGDRFVHINTHTEHTSSAVRLKQVSVITDFLKNNYKNLPVIITGDMNDLISADSMKYLLSSGFENSADSAMLGDSSPTFAQKIIDFLLVRKDKFTVYSYDVDTYKYGEKDPSDHCPVIIRYDIKK